MKPNPGEMVVLTAIPRGMLDDLPEDDQLAIKQIVGKPVLLNEYDDTGRAELEFRDRDGQPHFFFVAPEFIRAAATEAPLTLRHRPQRRRKFPWMNEPE